MIDVQRFRTAFETHRSIRETPRRFRRAAVQMFVGKWFSENGATAEQPLNLIELTVATVLQHLASACPQVLVTASSRNLRAAAKSLQLALNHLTKYEIGAEQTLQRWVLDALFGHAVTKVGVSTAQVELMGYMHDVGQPYWDNVSEDDFVFDVGATRKDNRHFEGNHYAVPKKMLAESGIVPRATMQRVKANEATGYNESGDERTETISHAGLNSRAKSERYYEMVDLWEIWFPQENKIALFQADDAMQIEGEPLALFDYVGPECGPFHELIFEDVPDQPTGLPLVSLVRDLHVSINSNYRKLTNQMDRQKFIQVYKGKNDRDAERQNDAADGHTVRSESDPPQTVRMGGIDQSNFAFFMDSMNRFDYMHRISALGGNAEISETAKQAEQMGGSASMRMNKMGLRLTSALAGVFRSLGWHLFYEPGKQPPIIYQLPGSGLSVTDRYTPDKREGDVLEYNFDIVPYSYQHKTPGQEKAELDETFNIVAQTAQLAGQAPNVEGYLRIRAELSGFKYLNDLIQLSDPLAGEQPMQQQSPSLGGGTHSIYERRNRGGGAAQQQAQVMSMMQAGAQEAAP
jgi:hypothetical protein